MNQATTRVVEIAPGVVGWSSKHGNANAGNAEMLSRR
jgi:hypothetical protein